MRGLLLVLGLLQAAGAAGADEAVIWRLDALDRIGGHQTELIGSPRILEGAIAFNGVDEGILVADLPLAGAPHFTIEALIEPASGGLVAQRFLHMQDERGGRALLEIRCDEQGNWWLDTFVRWGGEGPERGFVLVDPSKRHPVGRWFWVALRFDGETLAHYVDGVRECERVAAPGSLGPGATSLGVRQNHVSWFKGRMREVRFARTAVPESELQRMCSVPKSRPAHLHHED